MTSLRLKGTDYSGKMDLSSPLNFNNKIISKSNDFLLSSSMYTKYLENSSIIVSDIFLSELVLMEQKLVPLSTFSK